MMITQVKTRFCPSPTGFIHLGNLRTAIFNALLAKQAQGVFLLRIEDTDQSRSEARYTDALLQDLRWLGLMWQEGPEQEQDHGPYWQSQRQPIYDQYYQQLIADGRAFYCFCTEQQLAMARKIQLSAGRPPRYLGTCRNLTQAEIDAKLAQGLKPTLRFRVPVDQSIIFHDIVRGEQRFQSNDLGDFVIRRADGTAPFLYCNAIDDALMGVTHALRGEDHLTNTPRQLLVLAAVQLPAPIYGHIPLIVGSDGSPLSKRHGSRSVAELREQGFLPLAILNYLARLGHTYNQDGVLSYAELAEHFSLSALGRSPARYDEQQLLYWQRAALNKLDFAALSLWLKANHIQSANHPAFLQLIKDNIVFPADVDYWSGKLLADDWSFSAENQALLQAAGKAYFLTAINAVKKHNVDFNQVIHAMQQQLQVKGRALFQPLRVALTGELHGPEMARLLQFLGVENVLARLQRVLDFFPNLD